MTKHRKDEPKASENPRPDETSADPNEQVMPHGTGSVAENETAQGEREQNP